MKKIGIIGGAGYTAGELIRILLNHSKVKIHFVHSTSQGGKLISDIHQDLIGETFLSFTNEISKDVDVLFLCSGHGKSKSFFEKNDFERQFVVFFGHGSKKGSKIYFGDEHDGYEVEFTDVIEKITASGITCTAFAAVCCYSNWDSDDLKGSSVDSMIISGKDLSIHKLGQVFDFILNEIDTYTNMEQFKDDLELFSYVIDGNQDFQFLVNLKKSEES